MPFTAADAKRHIKGLRPSQESAWATIANNALKRCQDTGGSDCEGRAIRIANAGAKKVGKIAKLDEAQGLVYGWASVVTKNGEQVVDLQGDIIDPDELEGAAVEFMLHHRASGEMHRGEAVGTIVESVVMSPEKAEAMGFADDIAKDVPVGMWIGVKLDPAGETFAKVKDGAYQMFSIQGTAERIEA